MIKDGVLYPDAEEFAKNLGIYENDLGQDKLMKKVRATVKVADKHQLDR